MRADVKRFFLWCGAVIAALTVALTVAWFAGYRWNCTKSFPLGIWRLTAGEPKKGDLVFFRPPSDNPTIQWGREVGVLRWQFGLSTLMIKRIVGKEGDSIEITNTVKVNGQEVANSHVFHRDGAGRTIPSIAHSCIIPQGKLWLMSDYAEHSFDSRYFGPIDRSAILGLARPVLTW